MCLLFAILFLLNVAYHDTCSSTRTPWPHVEILRWLDMGGGYGRMGTMGDLGQMGQMMRRNGNVFQMLPIKNKLANSKDALPCGETYGLQ